MAMCCDAYMQSLCQSQLHLKPGARYFSDTSSEYLQLSDFLLIFHAVTTNENISGGYSLGIRHFAVPSSRSLRT